LYGAKKMNMISTGAFLNEMDASNKQPTVAEKFAAVWEKKNAKAARAGGVSLMALSLAACGSSSTTSSTTTTTTTTASSNSNFTSEIDSLAGGAGADTFTGDTNTVSEADSVAGGAGSDTVKIYGNTALPTLDSIESFYQKSLARDLDVSAHTEMSSVELDTYDLSAARDVKLATDASLTISNTTGTANAITLSNNVSTAQTITMTKSGDSTNAVDIDIDGDAVATLNVSSTATGTTGTSYLGLANTGAALTTVNITGSGDLVIEDVVKATAINITSTGKTTVDTAVAKVVVTGGAGADTVTLDHASGTAREFTVNAGAGDDKVDLGAMVLAADLTDNKVTITGGDGTDTLAMKSAMGAALSGLTAANFAKKGIANEFETIAITDQAATTDALGLARVGSIATTVDYAAGLGDAQTLTGLASGGTVVLGAAASAASDGVTVTVKDANAAGAVSDTLNIKLDSIHAGGTKVLGTVTADNVETVNLNSTSTKTTALVAADKNDVDLIIAGATTLNITGNVYADIGNDALDGGIQIVDASGNTAGVDVEVDHASVAVLMTGTAKADVLITDGGADVVKGGGGNDTITTKAGDDTITGGDGDDVIDSGVGDDTITGGAGEDDFVIAAIAANASNQDVDLIKDFVVGTDDLDVNVGLVDGAGASAAVTDFLDVAAGAATNTFTANTSTAIFEFSNSADLLGEGVAGTFDATASTSTGAVLEAAVIEQLATDVAVAQVGADTEHLIFVMYDESGNAVIVNYTDSGIAAADAVAAADFFEFTVIENVEVGAITSADFV